MLSYNICIAIIFAESAVKHGFTERAAISVITNTMFAKTSFDTSRVPGGCAASICRTGSVWPDYRGHGFTGGPMHIGDLSCHAVAAEAPSAYGPGGMTMTDNLDGRLAARAESDASISAPGQTCHGEAAAAAGRRAISWAGRPNTGERHATRQGSSPRRQLRLDARTSARFDVMAAETGRSPSGIRRTALVDYLDAAN